MSLTSPAERPIHLFSPKRHHNLFVAASEDYPAILNSLDRDLVNLSPDLEAELLALTNTHPIAVGYRLERQDPWLRKFYSRGYNLLARLLLGTTVRDKR